VEKYKGMSNLRLKRRRRRSILSYNMKRTGLENPFFIGTLLAVTCVALGIYGLANLDTQTIKTIQSNISLAHQLKEVGFETAKTIMALRNASFLTGGLIGLGLLHGNSFTKQHSGNS